MSGYRHSPAHEKNGTQAGNLRKRNRYEIDNVGALLPSGREVATRLTAFAFWRLGCINPTQRLPPSLTPLDVALAALLLPNANLDCLSPV